MYEENAINYYEKNIDLKQVISDHNLQDADGAFFVCNLNDIRNKYDIWKKYMPRITPFYAVKCNDDHTVVKTLVDLGASFDCASKAEIKQVLHLGVEPERIIFAHPCKMIQHLEYAREMGVLTSTVDSEYELYKLHKYHPESNVVIRIRHDDKHAVWILGNKYGCDAERDGPALILLAKRLNLKVTGVSFHVGSGCSNFMAYHTAISLAKRLFDYGATLGFDMDLVDIGGGFLGQDIDRFKKMSEIINQAVQMYFPDEKVKIIAEPGRYFVEASCTLISKIHAKREARLPDGELINKQYYLNDGVFGSFIYVTAGLLRTEAQHFVENKNAPTYNSLLWGPTCDSTDMIFENIQLPDLEIGDFIAFPNMGAYTIPVASRFNGFMLQKIIYYDKLSN